MPAWKNYFRETFVVDERSLVLARIFTFIALIWYYANYYFNFYLLSPEKGFLPAFAFPAPSALFPFNIYRYNNSIAFIQGSFLLALLASLFFLWGKWPKSSIAILWAINMSLRNQVNIDSRLFESFIQIMLIWLLFFPATRLSILWKKPPRPIRLYSGMPVAGWMLQLAILYFFSFLHKCLNPKWTSLEALKFIFNKTIYQTPLTSLIADHHGLLAFLTFFTLALEALSPLLIFWPMSRPNWRNRIILFYVFFHIAIVLFLNVGIFTPISLAAWMGLYFWEHKTPEATKDIEHSSKKATLLALGISLLVLICNIDSLLNKNPKLFPFLKGTGIYQQWSMYASRYNTMPVDLWLGSKATFKDDPSSEWDIMNNRPVDFTKSDRPQLVDYINRAFVTNLFKMPIDEAQKLSVLLPAYYCQEWNSKHEKKVSRVEIKIIRNIPDSFRAFLNIPQETDLISGACP